jgi:hypothetical protein
MEGSHPCWRWGRVAQLHPDRLVCEPEMGAERSYAAECGVHVVFVRAVPRRRNGTFFLDANVIALAIRSPTCTFISTATFEDDSGQ